MDCFFKLTNTLKRQLTFLLCGLTLFCLSTLPSSAADAPNLALNKLLRLTVKSSINPATLQYILGGQAEAKKKGFDALIIELNTPGGLVSTTKDIITNLGDSEIPTIIWIAPEGASATSAGAIIASSAHLLYMSEGTNIGAATPIQMSGDIPEDLRNKAINDLVALVQSLSEARGRNAELFGKMVSEAASFKSNEALEKKLINGIASTEKELFEKMNGASIHLKGADYNLSVNNPIVVDYEMSTGNALLNILADPNLAYILLLLGAALIYLEFQAPGGFIAGSFGAILLIISGISFQVLPLNFGALGLLALSFILFILEVYITSYGLLSLLGLAALVTGSLFLYETDNSYMSLAPEVIAAAIAAVGCFLGLVLYFLVKDIKSFKKHHFNEAIGKKALIIETLPSPTPGEFNYRVKVEGEIWRAKAQREYQVGQYVDVHSIDNDTLTYTLS